ncbi:MAG: hypothetical protein A3F11_03240 [Gammaproteobacteria bacterium RIFCSPHIGHO2_12_FULL_37_14]|nr:MAG: hypothetical protein A3F11_03240 [Gammaproteobacteria bacterium RIFCSPHIGHO2_12_FULL_37_14]
MIKRLYAAFKKEGFIGFSTLVVTRCFCNLIAFPVACAITVISPWIRIRFIKLYSWRIGHYGVNTHFMLCALETDEYGQKRKRYKTVCYADPRYLICNEQLHNMWKKAITIFPFRKICFQTDRFLMLLQGSTYENDPFKKMFEGSEGYYDRWRFSERLDKSYISFTEDEHRKAGTLMREMGIPPGAPFVCILVRDSKYLQIQMPGTDWMYHDYRNADINNYVKAMKLLAEKGFFVLRMGKYVNNKLDCNHPNVIDYASHELRSDFMDIYLSAHCSFFISTGCGIESVAQIFRRPLLATNYALTDFRSYLKYEIIIPKKVIKLKDNRLLTFNEIYLECQAFTDTPVCKGIDRKSMFQAWQEKRWSFAENTPDEIVEAVEDMLKRLTNGDNLEEEGKLLQNRFWRSFPAMREDNNMTSYSNVKMKIANSFLQRHESLLLP